MIRLWWIQDDSKDMEDKLWRLDPIAKYLDVRRCTSWIEDGLPDTVHMLQDIIFQVDDQLLRLYQASAQRTSGIDTKAQF